jgi:hypothetical protein
MSSKITVALAAALILTTASAVLAADSGENNQGGAVVPGSTIGVNPADHRSDPSVQSAKPPMSPDQGIRTEGRGNAETLREQEDTHPDKDPQDPGPSDTRK